MDASEEGVGRSENAEVEERSSKEQADIKKKRGALSKISKKIGTTLPHFHTKKTKNLDNRIQSNTDTTFVRHGLRASRSKTEGAISCSTDPTSTTRHESLDFSFKESSVEEFGSPESSSEELSPANSSEDTETAASRRAKFLQRYGSNTESSMQDDQTSEEGQHAAKSSNKKFHKRFSLPEENVVDDFLCALLLRGALLAQGSMYITANFVCFYANIFGKKTRVTVPFREIVSVKKCKILKSIPNSIEVHTLNKKYFWASFLHRDNAFNLIDSRWRQIRQKMGNPVIDEVRPLGEYSLAEWGVEERNELGYEWRDSDEFLLDEVSVNDAYPPLSPACCHQVERTPAQFVNAPRYSEKFPISVQDFYLNFLSDSSGDFWTEFHSRDGYTGFVTTKWSSSLEGCCLERQTNFKAPLRLSLATKHTRVSQRQRCRFASPDELIFETSSHSRDVPYSNQFLVDAVWKVTNTPTGCQLNIYVFVRFTKKNWLKGMIERNAIDGSREWFENWMFCASAVATHLKHNSSVPHSLRTSTSDILAKSVQHRKVDVVKESKETIHGMNRPAKLFLFILIICASFLFISTLYYFFQVRYYSYELSDVTENIHQIEENYFQLRTAISLTTTGTNSSDISGFIPNYVSDIELWRAQFTRLENLVCSLSQGGFSVDSELPELAYYDQVAVTLNQM